MSNWQASESLKISNEKSGETWNFNGQTIATVHSHIRFREPGDEKGNIYAPQKIETNKNGMSFAAETPFGNYSAKYESIGENKLRIEASFLFTKNWRGGIDLVLLRRPENFERCRLYDMFVSGWSDRKNGIVFHPLFEGAAKLTFNHVNKGEMQCLGLSCPAGIHKGERDFREGDTVKGAMEISVGNYDMWSPEIAGEPKEREAAPAPAKPYSEYIDSWLSFTNQPGLWIDLDEEKTMGMFHRGWFNFLSEKKVSGVLWNSCDTWNEPLIELSWGGSANVVLMETLFRLKDPRAQKILNALLYFKDGGFMHENGSWINGYQAAKGKFSDRYGREHSETATGGIINMMVWRCIKQGFVQEKEKSAFTERLEKFCGKFLKDMTSDKTGGIAFSRFWDGSPGAQREFIEYPEECYPVSDAFGAFSYMAAHILTGKEEYLSSFRKLISHLIGHLERNEWRFLEYDTLGADAVAPSWILLILDEALENRNLLSKELQEKIETQYHRTYKVIHSFVREREDYPDAEWKAAETWGGKTITQGAVIHGSTANSIQGAHSAHLRFDFPLAMGAYARRTGNRAAIADWHSYLNWTTHLQYADPRWPDVIGSTTEHISFKQGYVQDTAQIKHGNPIGMMEWMEFEAKSSS